MSSQLEIITAIKKQSYQWLAEYLTDDILIAMEQFLRHYAATAWFADVANTLPDDLKFQNVYYQPSNDQFGQEQSDKTQSVKEQPAAIHFNEFFDQDGQPHAQQSYAAMERLGAWLSDPQAILDTVFQYKLDPQLQAALHQELAEYLGQDYSLRSIHHDLMESWPQDQQSDSTPQAIRQINTQGYVDNLAKALAPLVDKIPDFEPSKI